jgi:fatty-acid peroxygenase
MLLQGYAFLPSSRKRYGIEVFEGRFFARRVITIAGRDAVRLFYDDSKFRRAGAMPRAVRKTLTGEGGVQTLDGEAHRHRKAMLLSVLDAPAVAALVDEAGRRWAAGANRWSHRHKIVLFDEAVRVFSEAVCVWAGVPAEQAADERTARDLVALVEGFGNSGLRHARARRARRRLERWAGGLVRDARAGRLPLASRAALHVIAEYRDLDGRLLDENVAAVEMLNVLRPTVAVAYLVTFAALALHTIPEWRTPIADGNDEITRAFVHEVRRYFPLTPAIAARVRRTFTWRGHRFPAGRLVVLDVFGTNHDDGLWVDPQCFDPRRFIGKEPDPNVLIPQGGGDVVTGHRCAGKRLTIQLLEQATRFLATLSYKVPNQDLRVTLSRVPTRPRSGFVMSRVKAGRLVTA